MPKLKNSALCLIPLLFLATLFWKPALLDGKTIIHGDSITDGLSLLTLQLNGLRHMGQLLWADGVYGGHPIFAEGQGAFASPFNMAIAWIVAPVAGTIAAMNVAHFLGMLITGAGVAGLCRELGASRAASCFASIAVAFSAIWIGAAQNMAIQGTLMWVPWSFWALEIWVRRPDVKAAILLGAALAMIILSGYPQAFHGAAIYMALTLVAIPFDIEARRGWAGDWRKRLTTGLLAALVCIGLSAVQWLPLLELTGLSHRSAGITNAFKIPLLAYCRGFLFTWPRIAPTADYFPGTGSLLFSIFASLVLVMPAPIRVKGHLVGAFGLLMLGAEEASPLFRLLYRNNLVPGLRYFRVFHTYIDIAIVGFAVLAAFAIDGVGRLQVRRMRSPSDFGRMLGFAAIIVFWLSMVLTLHMHDVGWANYAPTVAAIIGCGALMLGRRGSLIPLTMLAVLVAECLSLRLHQFYFYDPAILGEPSSAIAIQASPEHRDDKLFDASLAGGYGFTDSRSSSEPDQARRMMESICAMTNTLWGLRSINGALALPTHRQTESEKLMRDEIAGHSASPAGARLVDLLAVRFIAVDTPPTTTGFKLFWHDPVVNAQIMENTAARPRFQLYTRHVAVGSTDEAIETIKALKTPTLVIENPPSHPQVEASDDTGPPDDRPSGSFSILKAKSTEYRADVTTDRPAWFFVADADYPGWKATLDGKPAPMFPAQLLGKTVAIPAGTHRIEIMFESISFRIGLITSLFAIAATSILWMRSKPRIQPVPI